MTTINFQTGLSFAVLRIILAVLNGTTGLITIFNWYSLYQGFKNMKIYDNERRKIIWFYYEITLVPLLVAGCAHYGAQYPEQAIWLFPVMQIFLGFNFFWFIKMMHLSAGGINNVKYHLSNQPDMCGFHRMEKRKCCCCMMRKNLWLGMKARLWFLYLIYVKPLWAFVLSAMYKVHYDFPQTYNYIIRSLVLICTFVPLNAIGCFVVAITPISRLERIRPKLALIRIIVPVMQIQQLVISWLVASGKLEDLQHVSADYRGSRYEGTFLSFEMCIVAVASHFIYRTDDLKHWEHKQQYQWERQPARRTTASTDMDAQSELAMSELSEISIQLSALGGGFGGTNQKRRHFKTVPEDHSLHDSLRSADDSLTDYNSFQNMKTKK